MKRCYQDRRFNRNSLNLIDNANAIIAEYQRDGFELTLRQLYYQFVSRDLLRNTVENYGKLGGVINDARLAGLIDWDAIVDRTRNLASLAHWDSPQEIINACASQFRIDKWADQLVRPEVWVEKEALAGVVERACFPEDVAYFCCRGYTSQSEMWQAARRILLRYCANGQRTEIIHLGDHDPSGIDMSRDIEDRLTMFIEHDLEHDHQAATVDGDVSDVFHFERIALNRDQIDEYQPPPNPAKSTDSRFQSYVDKFGDESWELDALEPRVLVSMIQQTIGKWRDADLWTTAQKEEHMHRAHIGSVAKNWRDVILAFGK